MTSAPVPLAEQIAAMKGPIAFAEHVMRSWDHYPKSSAYIGAAANLHAMQAVLATLQQHERAMAVVQAVRAFSECTDANELDAERAMFDALAALDGAANTAGDAVASNTEKTHG